VIGRLRRRNKTKSRTEPDLPFPRSAWPKLKSLPTAICGGPGLSFAKYRRRDSRRGSNPANWNLSMLEARLGRGGEVVGRLPVRGISGASPKSFYQAQTALARGDGELARPFLTKPDRPSRGCAGSSDDSGSHSHLGNNLRLPGPKEDAFAKVAERLNSAGEHRRRRGSGTRVELALIYALTGRNRSGHHAD